MANELIEDWHVLKLLDFDLKDVLDLLVRLPWILGVRVIVSVPVPRLVAFVLCLSLSFLLILRAAVVLAEAVAVLLKVVRLFVLLRLPSLLLFLS